MRKRIALIVKLGCGTRLNLARSEKYRIPSTTAVGVQIDNVVALQIRQRRETRVLPLRECGTVFATARPDVLFDSKTTEARAVRLVRAEPTPVLPVLAGFQSRDPRVEFGLRFHHDAFSGCDSRRDRVVTGHIFEGHIVRTHQAGSVPATRRLVEQRFLAS